MSLDYLSLEPAGTANVAIIWMHGLGATGYDFYTANLPQQLALPPSLAVRFIFPHAPLRSVSLNNGYKMPAWYDIHGLDSHSIEDEAGLRETQRAINELIEAQLQYGIPSNKILLAGFSQGGAVSLYCGLRYPQRLGGIIALSTYLPSAKTLAQEMQAANRNIPIFMAHGKYDDIVSSQWAEKSRDYLQQLNYKIDWHSYPMEHELCLEELKDLREWLTAQLDAT